MPSSTPSDWTNRLAHERSPYLLQHAHNPVDWYPWGDEAFAKARQEDRPIFLSIGYSTCHWCHVMAHESFELAETARLMNELFVNIKLDREERPDVDRVYMTFVQATSGSGGWPMSVWLTPELKPIFGGTYFPPDDRYGRRGFPSVCRSVAQAWNSEREKVVTQGERIMEELRDYTHLERSVGPGAGAEVTMDGIFRAAGQALAASFDSEWGGFGRAPKFPRPVTLALLTRVQARLTGDAAAQARAMLLVTLDRMVAGGMHDHLGGGFHRYSVDRYWHVPHFEKMLYDQAQLTIAYLEAYQLTGEERYAHVVRDILDYVRSDLHASEGGYYSAEDADSLLTEGRSEHAEGAFYVWTRSEIEAALTHEEADAFCQHYGVSADGNAPAESDPQGEFTGKNILFTTPAAAKQGDTPELLHAGQKLFALRSKRPRPHLDDKIITAWNGLMISAHARAYQVRGHGNDLQSASRAADFIKAYLYLADDGILLRSFRETASAVEGFADDYAFLIQGLLDLYEAGFDLAYLRWAERLQDKQDELFYDPAGGGYFATSAGDLSVLLRLKEDHDGAEPSASSVSVLNLVRLAAMTGRAEFRQRASDTAAVFCAAEHPARSAQTMPLMLAALDSLHHPPKQIVVAGERDTDDTRALWQAIHARYVPGKVLLFADGGDDQRELARRLPYLDGITRLNGRATAYFCVDGACQLPTTDPAELARLL